MANIRRQMTAPTSHDRTENRVPARESKDAMESHIVKTKCIYVVQCGEHLKERYGHVSYMLFRRSL